MDAGAFEQALRTITGCVGEPPPWTLETAGETWRFRWQDITATWEAPDPEELCSWLEDNAERLREIHLDHLEQTWGPAVLACLHPRLTAAGVPEDVLEDLEITFSIAVDWPPHYAQAEAERSDRVPEIAVGLTYLADPDVEEVAATWAGPERIQETAEELAQRFLQAWQDAR